MAGVCHDILQNLAATLFWAACPDFFSIDEQWLVHCNEKIMLDG